MRLATCHPDRKHCAHELCKPCYHAKYGAENREERNKYNAKYYSEHREEIAKRNAKHYAEHREEKAKYYVEHRKERAKYHAKYVAERMKTDINFRIAGRLRSRIGDAVKNGYKSGSSVLDLGCSISQFKLYIENQFEPGMTWNNWSHDGWHLDHIQPLSTFDLEDRKQFSIATHYTNYQPLWAKDNWAKGTKLENWG